MSKAWYLGQNPDVKDSNIRALFHFFKYGRKEYRKWKEPRWFYKALGKNGWIWAKSEYFLSLGNVSEQSTRQNYKEIKIYRPGVYEKEVKRMRRKSLNSLA
jgi:hypothetical protein